MKLLSGILLIGAFVYAVALVILRRRAPDPACRSGWRRSFLAATALFVAGLGGLAYSTRSGDVVMCYEAGPTCYQVVIPAVTGGSGTDIVWEDSSAPTFLQAVAAAWQTLESRDDGARIAMPWREPDAQPKNLEEVKARCAAAVEAGEMTPREARLFETAYRQAAYHHFRGRTREGQFATCYMPTVEGAMLRDSSESLWQRLDALRAARAAGSLDEDTARKALEDICYSVELVRLFADPRRNAEAPETSLRSAEESEAIERALLWSALEGGVRDWRRMVELVADGTFDEATRRVAEWILRLEGATPPADTPEPALPPERLPDQETLMERLQAKYPPSAPAGKE